MQSISNLKENLKQFFLEEIPAYCWKLVNYLKTRLSVNGSWQDFADILTNCIVKNCIIQGGSSQTVQQGKRLCMWKLKILEPVYLCFPDDIFNGDDTHPYFSKWEGICCNTVYILLKGHYIFFKLTLLFLSLSYASPSNGV